MKQRIGWTFISFFLMLMLLAWTLPAKATKPDAEQKEIVNVTLLEVTIINARVSVEYQYIR